MSTQENDIFFETAKEAEEERKPQYGMWAKGEEFDNGKQIKIINFETLKQGEGNPIANYVNPKGYTFRLTFQDSRGVRYYENRYDSFRDDLRASSPKKQETGILTRQFQRSKKTEKGEVKYYTWVWKKL